MNCIQTWSAIVQVRDRLYGLVAPDTDGLVTADQVTIAIIITTIIIITIIIIIISPLTEEIDTQLSRFLKVANSKLSHKKPYDGISCCFVCLSISMIQ